MPLVTRQANQGNIFNVPTEPINWIDGDLWSDVGQNPPILKLNDNGTARPTMQSGTLVQGDINIANADNELGRLALGTAGQALLVNSGATALEYGTAGAWEVLDNYEASVAEGSHVFVPATALETDIYASIKVIIDMEPTASFVLQAVLNSVGGTNNASGGWSSTGSALTVISAGSAAQLQLCTSTMANTDDSFAGVFELFMNDSTGGRLDFMGLSRIASNTVIRGEYMHHLIIGTFTNINRIEIKTSTSTWKIGGKITIFGVRRS